MQSRCSQSKGAFCNVFMFLQNYNNILYCYLKDILIKTVFAVWPYDGFICFRLFKSLAFKLAPPPEVLSPALFSTKVQLISSFIVDLQLKALGSVGGKTKFCLRLHVLYNSQHRQQIVRKITNCSFIRIQFHKQHERRNP